MKLTDKDAEKRGVSNKYIYAYPPGIPIIVPGEAVSEDINEYIDIVCDQIEYLREDIVIHRLTGDPIKEELIEPKWILNKISVLNGIDKELKRRNTYQGIKYKK